MSFFSGLKFFRIIVTFIFISQIFSTSIYAGEKVSTTGLNKNGKKAKVKGSTAANQVIISVDSGKTNKKGKSIYNSEWVNITDLEISNIQNDAVDTNQLADDSVTSEKILDGEVATNDLADNAVSTSKIQDDSITTSKILDGEINANDIASNAVTSSKIQNGSVTIDDINTTGLGLKESTIVVAADGTGDTTDFVDAMVNILPASGGSVVVLNGTYTVTQNIPLVSNTHIIGKGRVEINKNFSGNLLSGSSLSNIYIENIVFNGDNQDNIINIGTSSNENIRIVNCEFYNNDSVICDFRYITDLDFIGNQLIMTSTGSANVMQLEQSADDVHIVDCTFSGGKNGVSLWNSNNIRIRGSNFSGNNHNGIDCQGTISNLILTDNRILNTGEQQGIQIGNSSSVVLIANNEIDDANIGIFVRGDYIRIIGNYINASRSHGIETSTDSSFITINGNVIRGSSTYGININNTSDSVSVSGNVILTSGTHHIHQHASATEVIVDGVMMDTTASYNYNNVSEVTEGDNRNS